jgi:DMSO/TMAO reductase YedYZ molybdopterin-dependent catalytic subunit
MTPAQDDDSGAAVRRGRRRRLARAARRAEADDGAGRRLRQSALRTAFPAREGRGAHAACRQQPVPTGSRTRIEKLYGAITPNCLLFERDHVGVPAIDQARHRLMIHGLVSRPLLLTMDELMRFPSVSRSGRRPPNCGMRRTAGTAPWRTEAARISLAVAA